MRGLKLERTYDVSILLMCLDAKYDGAHDGFAVEQVDRYGQRVVADPCALEDHEGGPRLDEAGRDFLVKNQTSGYWRYPSGGFDLSNTQYALLGLKAADRCGLEVPASTWKAALDFLLGFQAPTGRRWTCARTRFGASTGSSGPRRRTRAASPTRRA